jgi:hypothetical protein
MHTQSHKAVDLLTERNASRFAGFALFYCLEQFAGNDLKEWRMRDSLLAETPKGTVSPAVAATAPPSPKRKRGRPAEISNESKQQAAAATGNRTKAEILYGTKHPSKQQVKNVSAIMRHYLNNR